MSAMAAKNPMGGGGGSVGGKGAYKNRIKEVRGRGLHPQPALNLRFEGGGSGGIDSGLGEGVPQSN